LHCCRFALRPHIPEATIRGYVYNTKRKRVPPEPASRIVALMLAHRKKLWPL